ncbi:MAG: hypothetical protein HIU91_06460 [Acidobacteria bacterium]|nr:hypothetical protein [Acidobacteriota bacterium]
MNKIRFAVLSALCMLMSGLAHAAEPTQFVGTWDMAIGHRNLFILTLKLAGDQIQGDLECPKEFSSEHNLIFANMRGGVRHDPVIKSQFVNGKLHLTVRNADDPTDTDDYVMTVEGSKAELEAIDILGPVSIPTGSLHFERTSSEAKIATDWEPNRTYSVTDPDTDQVSAEMKAIYDEDQRVRSVQSINWDVVNQSDAQRREATHKLLAMGALHSGKDYEEASFIFQHGHTADDYLLAHTLAMVAASKGDPTAIWIAAATLDRYLQMIGQKQIYGTQFSSTPSKENPKQLQWTREPYAKDLVSDPLRNALGVPSLAIQTQQIDTLQSIR